MRINYTKVISQANEIESLGEDLRLMNVNLQHMIQEIPAYWKGEAANAYLKVCEELRVKISNTVRSISSTASDIKVVAERIKREDEERARKAAMLSKGKN